MGEYTIRKGSVTDRLLDLGSFDKAPTTKPSTQPPEVLQAGEENCYEVETILESRKARKGKGKEYLIKWRGWDSSTNTWQKERDIHSALVAAFEGKPAPCSRLPAPAQYMRGAGCARARLSLAAQKRGHASQTLSMVAGNVVVKYREPTGQRAMPTLKLVFFVLTMDKSGNITWPTNYEVSTQAALRMQVL